MAGKYELEGYAFVDAADLDRAKMERETIAYINAKTDMTDMKALYKIYRIAAERKSFQTIFGLEYMKELRERLTDSGVVTEDMLEPIPIGRVVIKTTVEVPVTAEDRRIQKDQEMMDNLRFHNTVKNFLIGVMAVVIGVMFWVTYYS